MEIKSYSRRLMSPFRGMLQVIEVPGGAAESSDGLHWKLYVADETIISHTGLSEVQYGSWSPRAGSERSKVRGTSPSSFIEETGERLIAALETWADRAPFPARDVHELCLLDGDTRAPLVLLETVVDAAARGPVDSPRWLPGAAAKTEFASACGDAEALVRLLSRTAGKRPHASWVQRDPSGNATTDDGVSIPCERLPRFFLRMEWETPEQAGLVREFLRWQAPWLLQLADLDLEARVWLECAAWERPLATDKAFRLYPLVLDREGLRVTRVKARLMGDPARAEGPSEPFYPFFIE